MDFGNSRFLDTSSTSCRLRTEERKRALPISRMSGYLVECYIMRLKKQQNGGSIMTRNSNIN